MCNLHIFVQVIIQTNIQLKMKISSKAKKKLNSSSKAKVRLCVEFDSSYDTIQRWIRENSEDNKLTTVKAVRIIEQETGLTENEILA